MISSHSESKGHHLLRRYRYGSFVNAGSSFLFFLITVFSATPAKASTDTTVFVLHGMGRTSFSMTPLSIALSKRGYRVVNWRYSSRGETVTSLSAKLHSDVLDEASDTTTSAICFVGHSLGGIVVRHMLATEYIPKARRLVMLAPPNQGSQSANRYSRSTSYFLTPMAELGTDTSSFVRNIPKIPEYIEVGIIAASADGKVTIENTYLPEQRDHIVVKAYHTFIMSNQETITQTIEFIESGSFRHK